MCKIECEGVRSEMRGDSAYSPSGDSCRRTKMCSHRQRGASSILAVFFVTLFATLAISFAGMTNINVTMSHNHQKMAQAGAVTESGLAYASFLITSYIDDTSTVISSQSPNSAL